MKKLHSPITIHFCLAVLVIFTYPFSIKVSSVAIGLWGVHWLWILIAGKGKKPNWSWLLPMLLFPLWYVVTLLYSTNMAYGIQSIEKRISLLLIPLIISTVPGWDKARKDRFFLYAYASALLAACFCLSIAIYNFLMLGENTFFWTGLTHPLSFHPGYFSFFISIVVFWMGHNLTDTWRERRAAYKTGAICTLIFLSLFQILLASRLQLFLFYFAVMALSISYWRKLNRPQLVVISLFFAVSVYFISTTFIVDRIKSISSISYKLDDPPEKFNELTIRFALAECSWEVIKKNWLAGVGAGDSYDELEKVYRQKNYQFGYQDRQDPHNEYLNVTIGTGAIGLLLLITTLALSLYLGIERRDPVHISFVLFFAIGCLLESMLSQQKGIVLFSLFNSIFVFQTFNKESRVVV